MSRHKMDTIWGELVFVLKPGIDLGKVVTAFNNFYTEYNPWGWNDTRFHNYASEGAVMLHAESGGDTRYESIDSVEMYLTPSDAGEYTARFCSVGSNRDKTENGYEQVKKFFVELSNELLEVRRWGESKEADQENQIQRVCHYCGAGAGKQEASFCWNCGASLTVENEPHLTADALLNVVRQGDKGESLRSCLVCHLDFHQGDLLAWCPFCGATAHRIHMLEFLHVNDKCPACGHHLEQRDLADQFKLARLRLPKRPQG